MKASVMLEKSSRYELLKVPDDSRHLGKSNNLLILHKETETGSPFLVVAGFVLNEVGTFEESVLAEIETVPESDYAKLKEVIRQRAGADKKAPITFW